MKILSYILLALASILLIGYCTVKSQLEKTTWGGWVPPDEKELIEGEDKASFQEVDKNLSSTYAVHILKATRSYVDDVSLSPATFHIKMDQLTPDTSGYYYMQTIYLDQNDNEHLISSYRVSSKSGSVAKQILKTNKWIEVN
ncbi:hypothetical protein [uncultured Fluviicola sp.]|uniref:hypothetical protein n=1 Tax=uncultured Fluviicola sp. TaxID=463303 RepID=UPI0025E8ADBC|nr:hypothetical protein [uncultured Fluviicola sp.]